MVKSMYAAIAGLRSHQSKMDVISNNIANVNTWGYKSRTANFQDAMYQTLTRSTAGDVGAGGLGGINSSQLGYGVNMGSISTNFTKGSYGFTGNAFDCMIDGTGFFIVGGMTNGVNSANLQDSGAVSLSRVGSFSMDGHGYLVDGAGNYIYGFVEDPANKGQFLTGQLTPIKIPNDATGTQHKLETYRIGSDGVITGVTKDMEQVIIGKIAVASVDNPNGLEQTAGYLYNIGPNAGRVDGVETVATTTGQIIQNYLELSNVDLSMDMASMITTQRGYQANTKIMTVTDEMLEQLVNMKR